MSARTVQSIRALVTLLTPISLLLLCAGFTIGLTFAPCYSSICVESYFPRETRFHIALYYTLLAVVALSLYSRRFLNTFRRASEHYLLVTPIPIARARVSVGGLLLCIWTLGLTLGSIGYWYPAENKYWMEKGASVDWTGKMFRVVWTGVTGHWCDIWIGLVILPVGRNSIISRAFRVQSSTLLQAHKAARDAYRLGLKLIDSCLQDRAVSGAGCMSLVLRVCQMVQRLRAYGMRGLTIGRGRTQLDLVWDGTLPVTLRSI